MRTIWHLSENLWFPACSKPAFCREEKVQFSPLVSSFISSLADFYYITFLSTRCNVSSIMVEMDRILRPGGRVYIRDSLTIMDELQEIAKAIGWHTSLRDTAEGPHASYRVLVCDKHLLRAWGNEVVACNICFWYGQPHNKANLVFWEVRKDTSVKVSLLHKRQWPFVYLFILLGRCITTPNSWMDSLTASHNLFV